MTEDHRKRWAKAVDPVVAKNRAEIDRIAGLLGLPAALVGVAVAHVGMRLNVAPSDVLGSFGGAVDRLRAKAGAASISVVASRIGEVGQEGALRARKR